MQTGHLILDAHDRICSEYRNHLSLAGQPGVGDTFVKWAHDNRFNAERCTQVQLTATVDGSYEEFPESSDLESFDKSDRKFVAAAHASQQDPEIWAALDRGWALHLEALEAAGLSINLLCPEDIAQRAAD
jgi:hypothetical protein